MLGGADGAGCDRDCVDGGDGGDGDYSDGVMA